jgi:hypothetical protein
MVRKISLHIQCRCCFSSWILLIHGLLNLQMWTPWIGRANPNIMIVLCTLGSLPASSCHHSGLTSTHFSPQLIYLADASVHESSFWEHSPCLSSPYLFRFLHLSLQSFQVSSDACFGLHTKYCPVPSLPQTRKHLPRRLSWKTNRDLVVLASFSSRTGMKTSAVPAFKSNLLCASAVLQPLLMTSIFLLHS